MTTYRHAAWPPTLLAAGALGAVALRAGQRPLPQARRLQGGGVEPWEDKEGKVDTLPSEPAASPSGPAVAR